MTLFLALYNEILAVNLITNKGSSGVYIYYSINGMAVYEVQNYPINGTY
jgi:hypothetical protein